MSSSQLTKSMICQRGRYTTSNGEDKVGAWIGKTDRGDFHMKLSMDLDILDGGGSGGCHFLSTLLSQIKMWPWNVAFGQIGENKKNDASVFSLIWLAALCVNPWHPTLKIPKIVG